MILFLSFLRGEEGGGFSNSNIKCGSYSKTIVFFFNVAKIRSALMETSNTGNNSLKFK